MIQKIYDVVCYGPIMVDVIFTKLSKPPKIREEVYTNEYLIDVGGGVAITAVGLHELKVSTAVISSVGNDFWGSFIYSTLRKHNIGTESLRRVPGLTNLSVEMSFVEGRATTTAITLEHNIELNDDIRKLVSQAKHLHIVGPLDPSVFDLLEFAATSGLTISMDFNSKLRNSEQFLCEILPFIDILMPNLFEASDWKGFADIERIVIDLASSIRQRGYCVVKMGENGSLASDGENLYKSDAFPTKVKDTTGAGDAFNVGFLFGFLNNKNITECMLYGNIMGSMKVQYLGGVSGILELSEFKKSLKEHSCA